MTTAVDLRNPFPGLRPFREEESDLFFGQEDRIEDLVYRLSRQRLIAVLGLSGSGKSSLVNAGLLALLRPAQLPDGRPRWKIARLNPGEDPLGHLAAALEKCLGQTGLRAELDLDTRAVPRIVERAGLDPRQNVLLVVDQFEELFRYQAAQKNEAAHFVQLLLEAIGARGDVGDEPGPIQMVLTMRSEFLGDCAHFHELAEQVNAATYLIPKMDRASAADVIVEPIELRGARIDPALVQHLINESEALEDGLPLLQHALRRLWDKWLARGCPDSPIGWDDLGQRSLGALLNEHLDAIYGALTPVQRKTAERLFRELADRDAKGRVIRRPVTYGELELPELEAVVRAFSGEEKGRSFLVRGADGRLDISHECLLRRWKREADWLEQEDRDREQLGSLARSARSAGWPEKKEKPLEGLSLDTLREWRDAAKPDAAWARRYGADWMVAEGYLDWSVEEARARAGRIRELEEAKLRHAESQRRTLLLVLAGTLLAMAGMGWLWWQARQANQRADAELGRSYWQSSRVAMATGRDLEAVHFAAAAIERDHSLATTLLLDSRGMQPTPEVKQIFRHKSVLRGAKFSQDESRILTWAWDSAALLWDARTGQLICPPLAHQTWVNGAQFNRDESRILSWSNDNTARLWDARSGLQIGPALTHQGSVNGAQFNRAESHILTWSNDNTARLWDARSGLQIGPALTHKGSVNGARFSPDESRILTWSFDNTARLWDTRSGQSIGPALTHQRWINGAQFSADGSRILTWSFDKTARLWDARNGQAISPTLNHLDTVRGAQFSRDEARILTWSRDKTAQLWDARTGRPIGPALTHQGDVFGAQFSADGSRILTWSFDKTARLWDAHTGRPIGLALTHRNFVTGAQFSRDESRILTWSDDGKAQVWDALTGQPIGPGFAHADAVFHAQFGRDQSHILTWSGDTARVWDARTSQRAEPILTDTDTFLGAQFSPDGSRVLTWSKDKTARLWDARTGQQSGPVLAHNGDFGGAQFSDDGMRILTWSKDKSARLWDARTAQQIRALVHQRSVNGAQFDRDASRILTWSDDGTARLWDASTGQPISPALTHEGPVKGAQFSRDESRILTWTSNSTAQLWDTQTGQQIGPAVTLRSLFHGAELSRDQPRILTWGTNMATVWDLRTGQPIGPALTHQFTVHGARFGRNELDVLTWSLDNTARLWDARSGQQIGPAFTHDDSVRGAQFNRDDSRILTWSNDRTARLWDARSGQQIGPALTHQDPVRGAQFSRDDSRILTWSYGNTARIWHLDADLDFPAEYVQLWIQAVTASELDLVTRQVNPLEPNRWRELKKRYESIAQAHAKVCIYPDANHWLRFHGK